VVDRYTKVVLTIIAAALWTLVLRPAVAPAPAQAQVSGQSGTAATLPAMFSVGRRIVDFRGGDPLLIREVFGPWIRVASGKTLNDEREGWVYVPAIDAPWYPVR
jgi:hypothetical protein